jgi:transposase-like protein
MGQSKFTPELGEQIVAFLREGVTVDDAAALSRIHDDTLRGWLAKAEGENAPPEFVAFAAATKEARALARLDALRIVRLAQKGWQASAWFLERSATNDWGRVWRQETATVPDEDDPLRAMLALVAPR